MSRRGNDSSVLLSDIEDSLRRVLDGAQLKHVPPTDEELQQYWEAAKKYSGADQDGFVPTHKVVRQHTSQGVRELSLKLALESYINMDEVTFTDDDVLNTARKFETFINGRFIADELPKNDDAPAGGDADE